MALDRAGGGQCIFFLFFPGFRFHSVWHDGFACAQGAGISGGAQFLGFCGGYAVRLEVGTLFFRVPEDGSSKQLSFWPCLLEGFSALHLPPHPLMLSCAPAVFPRDYFLVLVSFREVDFLESGYGESLATWGVVCWRSSIYQATTTSRSPICFSLPLLAELNLSNMPDSTGYHGEKTMDTEKNLPENAVIMTSAEARAERPARVNASGHVDLLDRQCGLLSICATAVTIGDDPRHRLCRRGRGMQ
ncbi:hypothetical protein K438DRAFT_2113255 [Mycena galopus ATCC 62051]|nr:hypothetical protein K438DRAFT_2113255 [Mycena galopus ATCC 62051]